jgi:hypothetical protein
MQYTGDPSDVCPISFAQVADLERPVGFDAAHAFECESIVEWLTRHKCTNPLTGKRYSGMPVADILRPLIVGGRGEHVSSTRQMLLGRAVGARRGRGAAVKFGSDVLLLLLQILASLFVRVSGNEVVTAPLADMISMALLIACIMLQYPVRGTWVIVVFLIPATVYTMLAITQGILAPNVTMALILHLWSVSLFATKVSLDINTEAFGAEIY